MQSSVNRSEDVSPANILSYSVCFVTGMLPNGIKGQLHLLKKVSPLRCFMVVVAVKKPFGEAKTIRSSMCAP